MKKLLIILLISNIMVDISAQKKIPEPVKIIGLYTASIALNAVGDALNDSGEKTWGHACNAASIGSLLLSPVILDIDKDNWGYYLATYVTLRFSLFDYTYNATRGLDLNYIGNSSITDKFFRAAEPTPGLMLFTRSISFTVGIATPITKLNDNHIRHYLNKNRRFPD